MCKVMIFKNGAVYKFWSSGLLYITKITICSFNTVLQLFFRKNIINVLLIDVTYILFGNSSAKM